MHILKVYKWLNKEKDRYYIISVRQDGSTNIILDYNWGGCHSNRGGRKSVSVQNSEEAQSYINKMMKRRKSRGYELLLPIH